MGPEFFEQVHRFANGTSREPIEPVEIHRFDQALSYILAQSRELGPDRSGTNLLTIPTLNFRDALNGLTLHCQVLASTRNSDVRGGLLSIGCHAEDYASLGSPKPLRGGSIAATPALCRVRGCGLLFGVVLGW
jgi:hypothetical protein